MKIQQIAVRQITEDPEQPRKTHSEESLQGLADSIKQHGMLNPITVSPTGSDDRYLIVTGERRWRAAQMAKLDNYALHRQRNCGGRTFDGAVD